MDALDSERHFPQDPHLVTSKTELCTLEVGHFEARIMDQTVVHK